MAICLPKIVWINYNFYVLGEVSTCDVMLNIPGVNIPFILKTLSIQQIISSWFGFYNNTTYYDLLKKKKN